MARIDTVRAEIERRKNAVEGWAKQGFSGAKNVYKELESLLALIDSLEKNPKGADEAAQQYAMSIPLRMYNFTDIVAAFRAGYKYDD